MWDAGEKPTKFILHILPSHLVIEILLRDDWASKLRNSCLFQGYRVPRLCKHMVMYYFTLHPLIHNRAHPDYSCRMPTWEFWLTSATLISFVLPKRTVSLLLSGWDGSFSTVLAEKIHVSKKPACIHKWTDLSGTFDWKEMCLPPHSLHPSLSSLSLYTRHPVKLMQHKQSIWRQRKDPLAHRIMARHQGDENFCFISFAAFLPLHRSPCRRWNIKEELLLIQAINDSHKVWIEFNRFLPIACFPRVTQDSSNSRSPFPPLFYSTAEQ